MASVSADQQADEQLASFSGVSPHYFASAALLFKLCKKHPYGQFVEDGKSYNNMWKIKQILEENPHFVSMTSGVKQLKC